LKYKTQLYRAFDDDGNLLYVGISSQVFARFDQHAHTSEWMYECCYVEIEHFRTRNEALAAEKYIIQTESPKFNQVHKRNKDEARNLSSKTHV
jgi:excinuclease UvrABC nuclease subunit